jgi:hypothetical protein
LGNIAGDAPGEFAAGAPGTPAVHIASACANAILRTIADPGGDAGGRFGAAIAPLGDRNADGFIDLIVGAPQSDGGAGTAYVFTSSGPAGPAFAGCGGPTEPGGGTVPGTTTKPPGSTVRARVLRRLTLVPSRHRLSRGKKLGLKGSLKVSASQAGCQVRQKIALQRRKLSGGRFQTFDVAVTAKDGGFKAATRPSRSYLFRARISQTARCMGATSKREKVVVRRRAKSTRAGR